MLNKQRQVSSNFLLHNDESTKFSLDQIYVPLALEKQCKSNKKEDEHDLGEGSRLYEPQHKDLVLEERLKLNKREGKHYLEEKTRLYETLEPPAFLQQISERESQTQGRFIALIGKPGAGKTTTLQNIAFWVLKKDLGLPIWISLADLEHDGNLMNFQTYLFEDWLDRAILPEQRDIAKKELATQIQQGRVWLLLDGIDEVAASGVNITQHISQQITGWLVQSQVILTCRLNVWQADLNFLSDFETYRLLDFDYPQRVHQFIDNWFNIRDVSKGKRLKSELARPDKERLRNLIQNPLRLMLLCRTWQYKKAKRDEANLPDTKAEL